MSKEENPVKAAPAPDTGTRLAYERTWLAHERTQMAWVRTALTLISFGFTIAKFFEYLREKQAEPAPLVGAKTVGILMISAGIVSLTLATAFVPTFPKTSPRRIPPSSAPPPGRTSCSSTPFTPAGGPP